MLETAPAQCNAGGIESHQVCLYDLSHVCSRCLGDRLVEQRRSEELNSSKSLVRTSNPHPRHLEINSMPEKRMFEWLGIFGKKSQKFLMILRRPLNKKIP